jgi:drug/metabolite transporter (DMT)-like permease
MLLSFLAFKHTILVSATIIISLQPGLTLVVAGPLFGEFVSRRQIAWTIVSVGGVVLTVTGSSGFLAWSAAGELAATGSLLAWTVYWLVS